MTLTIRRESAHDTTAIAELTQQAFLEAPHSSHTEQFIVDALRRDGQLSLSLVAEHDGQLVGHVALSPVTLSDGTPDWYGLGPISVQPDRQGQGIGTQLMRAALAELPTWAHGVASCWGSWLLPALRFQRAPGACARRRASRIFQALRLGGDWPTAKVSYAPGFAATA